MKVAVIDIAPLQDLLQAIWVESTDGLCEVSEGGGVVEVQLVRREV